MRIPVLNELGKMTSNRPITFNDEGPGASEGDFNPLHEAFAHTMPTAAGYIAGSFRVARQGHVVNSLLTNLKETPLLEHLLKISSSDLAVIFGDNFTAKHVQTWLADAHKRAGLVVSANELPTWFVRTYGAHAYSPQNRQFRRAILTALQGAVSLAHMRCGLLQSSDTTEYCRQLALTVGWASQMEQTIPTSVEHLRQAGQVYEGIPLLDAATMQECGIAGVLGELLDTELAPGMRIGELWQVFGGFMYPDDRAVICELTGWSWTATDEAAHQSFCDDYFSRVLQKQFDHADLFDVAVRRAQIP